MKIEISQIKGVNLTKIISDQVLITQTQDALDLMAESTYRDSWNMILHQKNLAPDFFDLKTGLAGEILQKFSTYNVRLAIIGDFSVYSSKSLRDFIFESNKYGRINFVSSPEEAKERLTR